MEALLEREGELGVIERQLDSAVAGEGSLVVVEGPAGIGKTTLLARAMELARDRGMAIHQARGGTLEQRLEFGIVRQLVERRILRADEKRRAELLGGPAAAAGPLFGLDGPAPAAEPGQDPLTDILHALYWVVANLAEESPLLLVVDDAQWGDTASLRSGGYLARRLADLPVAFIVGIRADEPSRQAAILGEQIRLTEPRVLQLRPLSTESVGRILANAFGGEMPAVEVVAACERASGGNPFFLAELAKDLAGGGSAAADLAVGAVGRADLPAVKRSLLLRLGQLGEVPGRLARALATLGGEGELRHAAAIAGLDTAAAAEAADTMVAASLAEGSRPVRLAHPLIRAAIEEDMGPSELARAHRRAFEVLRGDGLPDEALLAHALEAEPSGDPELVAVLMRTAELATRTGSPDTAAVHLERALAEPPSAEVRPGVLAGLGAAEVRVGSFADGLEHLRAAFPDLPADDERWAGVRRDQMLAAFATGGMEAARSVLGSSLAEVDASMGLQLEADLALLAWLAGADHGLDLDSRAGLPGDTRAERTILSLLSQERLAKGGSPEEAIDFARRGLAGRGPDEGGDAFPWYLAVYSLLICEANDEARPVIEAALADGRTRGSAFAIAGTLGARAVLALNEGRPADAEVDARTAVASGLPPALAGVNAAYLVMALTEQGDLEAAERALREGGIDSGPGGPTVMRWIPWARARLREAQGRPDDVRSDVAPLIEDERTGWAMRSLAWRALLARSISGGEGGEAAALASQHLDWAQGWGLPAALGVAQRAAGLATEGEERITRLEAAAATHSASALRTEEARARSDLGVAHQRAGRRKDGRRELEEAVGLALGCGARSTARRAAEELDIAGASPRALPFDELTPSERRVAEMAAAGRTNRQIAEQLYVSAKTVENHLTRAYAKLGVGSRRQLEGAL
jgi:DNA-binding CsgD family transcriptional regulator